MKKSNKERKKREQKLSGIYKRMPYVNLGKCYYCNDPRETLDHVPPLKYACDMDIDKFVTDGGVLLLVPSCKECNSFLSSKPLFTIPERVVYLYEKYTKNADKVQALWDDEEISELGHNMQLIVQARDNEVRRVIKKAQMLEERLLSIEINGVPE